MNQLILIIAAALFVIILLMTFRISALINVAKESDKKRVTSSNKVNAALMMLFLIAGGGLFIWYSVTRFDKYTLPVASEHGVWTDQLWWVTMAVILVVFIITHILLFVFSYKYQYNDKRKALFYPDNNKLELLWTVAPAIVLAGLVFTGLQAWNDITSQAPEDAEVVEIMGYQFAWKTRYPGVRDNTLADYDWRRIDASNEFGMVLDDKNAYDDFTSNELHIPVNKPILFKIRAKDVLHSVFAPHFRLKMDAVPGMPTRFKFTATKTTEEMRNELNDFEFDYFIACTEVCGRGHFSMKMKVVVESEEDYIAWKASQDPWLKQNPEYLAKVPDNLKELAIINSGIDQSDKETIAEGIDPNEGSEAKVGSEQTQEESTTEEEIDNNEEATEEVTASL